MLATNSAGQARIPFRRGLTYTLDLPMKNGAPYEIHRCVEPDLHFTRQLMKEQIRQAMKCMSTQSLWYRFAAPVHELSDEQLDYLTDLDGHDRVAWCAVTVQDGEYRGIGLSRYIRFSDQQDCAEFAVTVIDAFQGRGIGRALLEKLIESARDNGIRRLRGFVLPGNKRMLELCRHLRAEFHRDNAFMCVELPVEVLERES